MLILLSILVAWHVFVFLVAYLLYSITSLFMFERRNIFAFRWMCYRWYIVFWRSAPKLFDLRYVIVRQQSFFSTIVSYWHAIIDGICAVNRTRFTRLHAQALMDMEEEKFNTILKFRAIFKTRGDIYNLLVGIHAKKIFSFLRRYKRGNLFVEWIIAKTDLKKHIQ